MNLLTEDEKQANNNKMFIDGSSEIHGSKKFMTKEEKERIHVEIDKSMKELEDTGLSRE